MRAEKHGEVAVILCPTCGKCIPATNIIGGMCPSCWFGANRRFDRKWRNDMYGTDYTRGTTPVIILGEDPELDSLIDTWKATHHKRLGRYFASRELLERASKASKRPIQTEPFAGISRDYVDYRGIRFWTISGLS